MKSKSTLAILLAFVMILTAMPITGSAADAETYSLTDLIGTGYEVTYSWEFTSKDTAQTSVSAPAMDGDEAGNAYMGETGDAVEMRIKVDDSVSTNAVTIQASDNADERLVLTLNSSGASMYTYDNNSNTLASSTTVLTGQWVTLLVINNGQGYDVYYKFDGATEYSGPLFETATSRSGERGNIWFSGNGFYVDYVKKYGPEETYSFADLMGTDYVATYTWTNPNKDAAQTSLAAPAMDGDEAGNAYMGETGDAVEMRIKVDNSVTTNAVTMQAADNADERLVLTLNSSGASMYTYDNNSNTLASSTTVLTGQWVTLLVINNGTGYDVYYKFDGATEYSGPLLETATSRTGERSNIWFNGTGYYVDYVTKYGPSEGADGLVVAVSKSSAINSLRAIVSGKSGSLIFAGYDENECLVSASIRPVDGTTVVDEEILDTTTLDSKVTDVKVFFWDSMTGMNPVVTNVRSVSVD